jgi:hypothetical protein
MSTDNPSPQKSKLVSVADDGNLNTRDRDLAVWRHTGTLLPGQPLVPAQVPALCRPKRLVHRRCAGVPATDREASLV